MPNHAVQAIVPLAFPWQTSDPFLFCVYHQDAYPKGNEWMGPAASLAGRAIGSDFEGVDGWRMYHGRMVPGFPQHPHRGFETVTIVRRGYVDHSDSLGATARYGPGDVQWLTAGSGVLHAEMFPLREREQSNDLELFQIWLNLPRRSKFVKPYFSMFWRDRVPRAVLTDERGRRVEVVVVAGSVGEVQPLAPPPESWAASPDSHVAIWTAMLEAGAVWGLPGAPEGTNRSLYVFRGSVSIAGEVVRAGRVAIMRPGVDAVIEAGEAGAECLVLQGRPIGEPVAHYGPFVMNTDEEIRQAIDDYRRTQFGGWPWTVDDPVHPREQDRFARHPDGREDRP